MYRDESPCQTRKCMRRQKTTSLPAGAIMNPPLRRWVPSPAVPASPERRMPVLSSVYGLPGNACRFTQFALRGADTFTIPKPFIGSSLDMRLTCSPRLRLRDARQRRAGIMGSYCAVTICGALAGRQPPRFNVTGASVGRSTRRSAGQRIRIPSRAACRPQV